MVYAKFGGQTECIMGNWKIENTTNNLELSLRGENNEIVTPYDSQCPSSQTAV